LFNFYIGAEDGENFLAGNIVLAVLLVISLVILAYFIYQRQTQRTRAGTEIIQKIFMKILTKSKMMRIMNK
jgi:hypothetical protein